MALGIHLGYGKFYRLPLARRAEIVYVTLVSHGLVTHAELVVLAVAFDTYGNFGIWGDCGWGQVTPNGSKSAVIGEGNGSGEFAVAFRGEG